MKTTFAVGGIRKMKINKIKFPTNIFGDEPSLWVGEGDMLENAMGVDMDVLELKKRLVDTHIEIVTSDDVLPKGEFIHKKEDAKKKDPIKSATRWAIAAVVLSSVSVVLALIRALIMEGVIK